MDEATLTSTAAALNDTRQFRAVVNLFNKLTDTAPSNLDVHFLFQVFVAQSMLNLNTDDIVRKIEAHEDCTNIMCGDIKRDIARQLMRQSSFSKQSPVRQRVAEALLENAHDIHRAAMTSDTDYGIAFSHAMSDLASIARLNYLTRCHDEAADIAMYAVNMLKRATSREGTTLYRNAAFDALRFTRYVGKNRDARTCLKVVRKLDPSWKKRFAACAIMVGGKPAINLIERWLH